MADKIATREAYGNALVEFGAKYENLIVLDADLAAATKTGMFKKAFPDRFFDCGIAENNMVDVAVGLSLSGKIPFASTFAMFAAGRSYEQVRNSIGYAHTNVKIGATHGGITVGEDGATHQCNEDFALMRTIPGMTVICPAEAVSARLAVKAAIEMDGPVYIRFGRMAVPVLYGDDYAFEIGKGTKLVDGNDVSIIANGVEVHEALAAAEALKAEGISASVIDMATIKPIDRDLVIEEAKRTGAIVTCEEHTIIGGLGAAVCEVLAETVPTPVIRIGVKDCFGRSGPAKDLIPYFGLDSAAIAEAAKKAISLKK